MRVAVHQPNYLPWMGFFSKILESDVFVLLDTVQYSKNGYQNRVRIKTPAGPQWLTQPVALAGRSFQATHLIEFAEDAWGVRHIRTLQANYARAPHFSLFFEGVADILSEPGQRLAECNERLIRWICSVMGLDRRIERASNLMNDDVSDPTDRLIQIIKLIGADAYISGRGGFGYQDEDRFRAAGIHLLRSKSVFPEYPQLWGPHVAGLSIIDLLMNCGADSRRYLEQGRVCAC